MLGHNRQTVKLGRGTYRPDYSARLRALRMAAQLPQPPTAADNTEGITEWGMLANDTLSDCTCAAALHALQVAQLSQPPHTLPQYTPAQAISLYSKWCGYVPGKPGTDEGGVEADIIDDWTRDTCEGVPLLAHADIGQTDLIDTARAIAFYGSPTSASNCHSPPRTSRSGISTPRHAASRAPGAATPSYSSATTPRTTGASRGASSSQ